MIFTTLIFLAVLVAVLLYVKQRRQMTAGELEAEPFRFEDSYVDVPEIRAARARAMAVPGKHPAIRTRRSRSL